MRKFLIGLAALLFTSPVFASVDHWTCSNDTTVMYFILDTSDGTFMLFDSGGEFLASSKFTSKEKTDNGVVFLYSEVNDKLAIGVSRSQNNLVLAVARAGVEKAVTFRCQ